MFNFLRSARSPRRLAANDQGTTSIELAIIAPILMLLLLGTVDIVNYTITTNRVGRIATQTADAVTRQRQLFDLVDPADYQGNYTSAIGVFFDATNEIANPIQLPEGGRVILSSIANVDGTGPRITWQRTRTDYQLDVTSSLGAEGELAQLPDGFVLRLHENAIVAEVYYEFKPLTMVAPFLVGGPESTVRVKRLAIFRPRFGSLATFTQE